MLTVHHLNNSRSHRILWLLEELQLNYEIKPYQRNPRTMLAPNSLKKIHPLGKSPVVTDGSTVVAESGAIIEYLIDKATTTTLRPSNKEELNRYRYWLHYAEGSLMPPLLLSLIFSKLSQSPTPLPARPVGAIISKAVHTAFLDEEIRKHVSFVNAELEQKTWFCGETFTGADIQMSFPLAAIESRIDLLDYNNITRFLAQIKERPSYSVAIEKGGPVIP